MRSCGNGEFYITKAQALMIPEHVESKKHQGVSNYPARLIPFRNTWIWPEEAQWDTCSFAPYLHQQQEITKGRANSTQSSRGDYGHTIGLKAQQLPPFVGFLPLTDCQLASW
jgi:hypothetical protein